MMRRRTYAIETDINGGEYTSNIVITCAKLETIDGGVIADGVRIVISDPITGIERRKGDGWERVDIPPHRRRR